MNCKDNITASATPVCHWGAEPDDWAAWQSLGLTSDLLPVVSDPAAEISPASKMRDKGKTPSVFNRDGHVVGIPKWTSQQSTDQQVGRWAQDSRLGICVQTRVAKAIDIDVADPVIAQQIADFIAMGCGEMPMRKRSNSGKRLLVFSLAADFPKRVIKTPYGIIELLSTGQQFIAVGTHTSGVPYDWPGGLPTALPELSMAEVDVMWAAVAQAFGMPGGSSEVREGHAAADPRPRRAGDARDHMVEWLQEHGWVTGYERDGRVDVRCPWESGHSTDSGPSSTSWFPAGDWRQLSWPPDDNYLGRWRRGCLLSV